MPADCCCCIHVAVYFNGRDLLLLQSLIYWNKKQKNPRAAENFDPIFTRGKTDLTPPDKNSQLILSNLTGDEFRGFSWANRDFHQIRSEDILIPTLS